MKFKGEFYNIMPIVNMPSVIVHGILSNTIVKRKVPGSKSVAMQLIQKKRDSIEVPNGLQLHNYANLYFDARNPMMYILKTAGKEQELCVLTISADILQIADVVLCDQNASSSKYARFFTSDQIDEIDFSKIYARDWTHPNNKPAYYEHKSTKCAEVLVPHFVPPNYILSAHVVNLKAKKLLQQAGFTHNIMITPDMFFC